MSVALLTVGATSSAAKTFKESINVLRGPLSISTSSIQEALGVCWVGTAQATPAGTISSSGTTVTGSGTNFVSDAQVGDVIQASSQQRLVTAIGGTTSLTTDTAFSPVISAGSSFNIYRPLFRVDTDGTFTASATSTFLSADGRLGLGISAARCRLHIVEPTLGNEVVRVESTAGNDDPRESVYQNRAATTDPTQTTLHTLTVPARPPSIT